RGWLTSATTRCAPRSRSPRRSATTSGASAWTPPTSSPTSRCSACTATRHPRARRPRLASDAAPTGVAPELVELTRDALDDAGFPDVRIVVSGGFTADRIREFEA